MLALSMRRTARTSGDSMKIPWKPIVGVTLLSGLHFGAMYGTFAYSFHIFRGPTPMEYYVGKVCSVLLFPGSLLIGTIVESDWAQCTVLVGNSLLWGGVMYGLIVTVFNKIKFFPPNNHS